MSVFRSSLVWVLALLPPVLLDQTVSHYVEAKVNN
jgi:hypothetical protein